MFLALSLTFLTSFLGRGAQQDSSPEPTILRVSSTQVLTVPGFVSVDRAGCDAHGNLYFRLESADSNYNVGGILRLDVNTQSPTLYQLPSALASGTALMGFSFNSSGRVWFLNESKDETYAVTSLDSDGQVISQTKIDTPKGLFANRFLVAEDGVILVGGYFPGPSATKEPRGKSYLAIFDKSGTVRKVFGSETLTDVDLSLSSTKMIEAGIVSGQDGNFYYLQGNEILVISEWGELLRRIKIQRPRKASDALGMDLSEGLISIEFYEKDADRVLHPTFDVIQSSTGEPYGLYKPNDELGTVMVCFSRRGGYVFSRIKDGKINLLSAPLR
jgi:hypothetical protein